MRSPALKVIHKTTSINNSRSHRFNLQPNSRSDMTRSNRVGLSKQPSHLQTSPVAKPPLKIALLTYSTKPRGGVIHTLELAEALQALGHQVCVFALDKDRQGFCRPLSCDYVFVPATEVADPQAIDQVVEQRIQDYVTYFTQYPPDFDIYHAQDCISANALVALRERQLVSAVIRTVHHVDDYPSAYLEDCQRRGIVQPDLALCVSHYWQTQICEQYGVVAPQVFNGVDTARFSAQPSGTETALKQALGLSGSPLFLTVGGIEPRKNSIRLLQAFAQVLHYYPSAQLVVAGGITMFNYDAYRDQFLTEAKRLNVEIGQALVLTGVIADADMPVLYRCADAFVFPSVVEGWGLVVMEAIASGLTVITSNQPPFTEFLSPHQALLVDPHHPDTIAAAMIQSLDPAVAQPLIQASQVVCTRYTWAASAEIHLNLYQHLLTARSRL